MAVTAGRIARLRKKLADQKTNIRAGARCLAYLINIAGRLELALAAYNAGEARATGQPVVTPETRTCEDRRAQLYSGLTPPALKAPLGRVHVN
jgi:hypothetical protein